MREDAVKLCITQLMNQRCGVVIYNDDTHSWNDRFMNGYVHSYVSNQHIHTYIYIYVFIYIFLLENIHLIYLFMYFLH
jgi:hypothetical protein